MLKTEHLFLLLKQYDDLALHHNEDLKQMTLLVINSQKQRMQQIHPNLFNLACYTNIKEFFFKNLYSFEKLELLAQQLRQALDEKIKLDRWLPNEVLDTILNGFKLALLTLETDSQLARLLIEKNLTVTTTNLLHIIPASQQQDLRQQQLDLLSDVSRKMHKFAHSFILRSAFKFAQPTIEQRGFGLINQYINDGLQAMRSHKKSSHFFKQLVHQEKLFLNYLNVQQVNHLDLHYDVKLDRIMPLVQHNMDLC